MAKSPWRSFKTKSGGTMLRQDSRCKKGTNRTDAQKKASSARRKKK